MNVIYNAARRKFSRSLQQCVKKLQTKSFTYFLPVALCISKNDDVKNKLEFQAPKTLTHEYLIMQASGVAVNASTQLLMQTVAAIIDTAEDYKKALTDLMSLLQECKETPGNEMLQQELSDLMIVSRSRVNDFKTQLIQLETFLKYVEKVVVSTAETSFLAGSEFVSTALSERLHSAKAQVETARRSIKMLEDDYLILQRQVIFLTGKQEKKDL